MNICNRGRLSNTVIIYWSEIIKRVEGHVTWVVDFKAAFQAKMETKVPDDFETVLSGLGYKVSEKFVNVCKACKKQARNRYGRCCSAYNHTKRSQKTPIYNMMLVTV